MKTAGLAACSDGEPEKNREIHRIIEEIFRENGIELIKSRCIYKVDESPFSGNARNRAEALMELYKNPAVDAIFDLSGGNLANELLPELDYEQIARSGKKFWGYSDLTAILNGIYARCGQTGVLWQVKNLTGRHAEQQRTDFFSAIRGESEELYRLKPEFLRGTQAQGILVGGNIRCFLKLAGTAYFPDLNGKLLLLEANSGGPALIASYLAQLKQLGAFEQISGLILGTFTQMEREGLRPAAEELVLERVPAELPVLKTRLIGHGSNAHAAKIGGYYHFVRK